MSDPGGLLPLLALDPGRDGRGSAFRFVMTGGLWKHDKDKPYDGEVLTSKWKELMTDQDPVALEPFGDDKENDPPLIVSDEGHLMLTSTYDSFYFRGDFTNPVSKKDDLYGIPGSEAADTAAKKILFENGNPKVDGETGLLITEDYIPSRGGGITVGPGLRDAGQDWSHAVRGQVWIWWYGNDARAAVTTYRTNIARYILEHALERDVTPDNFNQVFNGLSVTMSPIMEGLQHSDETGRGRTEHVDYRRVSFEFRTSFDYARVVMWSVETPPDSNAGWYTVAWAQRWAEVLTGSTVNASIVVKGLEGLGMNDEGSRDRWRFYRLQAAIDEGEDVPLPRASHDPSLPDALPGMMEDRGRRYW